MPTMSPVHTWTLSSGNLAESGTADTLADAWDAAYRAAAAWVADHMLVPIVLDVDGERATVEPAASGDRAADVAATLAVLEDSRAAIVTAHTTAHTDTDTGTGGEVTP